MLNLYHKIKSNKDVQLSILLVVFFMSEALTKITYYNNFSFHNYSAIIKGSFIFFSVIFSLLHLTKKRIIIILFVILMGIFFIIGQYVFNLNKFDVSFLKNFVYFSRYIFIFTIILVFTNFPFNFRTNKHLIIYENIVIINSLFILIGVIFNLKIFRTYSGRFGFNGLFLVPSITTYFYALALTYFGYFVVRYNKKKVKFIFIALASLFVGTKALLLFLALTFIHIFIVKKIYKFKSFYIIFSLFSVIILYFFNAILNYLKHRFDNLYNLYVKYDLITMLTSYRNLRLKKNFLPLIKEKWYFINYMFGGTNFDKYRVEFEIFDVFLFFGIIGSIIFFLFYFKNIIKFSELVSFGKIQIIFLLFIASLSGTFFNNAPLALYLLVVLSVLNLHNNYLFNE